MNRRELGSVTARDAGRFRSSGLRPVFKCFTGGTRGLDIASGNLPLLAVSLDPDTPEIEG